MGKIFDLDNIVFRFLGKMGDIVLLNILFVLSSIPLITIGAGVTAMYDVTMKLSKNEESYIIKGYFSAMKSNFKRSTLLWITVVVAYVILFIDINVTNMFEGTIWSVAHYLLVLLFVVVSMLASYVFVIQAKVEDTYLNTWKNALIMSIKYLPTTLMVLIFNSVLPFCLIASQESFWNGLIAFGFFGFALVTFINSVVLLRVFNKYYEM